MSKKCPNSEGQKWAKTDRRYWRDVVFRPRVSKGTREVQQFYVKIQYQGRRENFPLESNNQEQAAEQAKRIYLALVAKGWDETIKLFKPEKAVIKPAISTVRSLIGAALERHDIGRRTLTDYCRSFRFIVAQVLGMKAAPRKSKRAERLIRQKRIDDTKLTDISPRDVEKWRQEFLAAASAQGPLALRRAKNTLNSTLRKARSLLSPKFLRHLDIGPGFRSPLDGVAFEPRQSMRYHSQVDLDSLVRAALHGDKNRKLEALPAAQLKAFLLAGLAGLRRNEIDKLEWSALHWDDNVIQLQATEHFHPKTEESLGDVVVDAELIQLFRELHKSAKSNFVIESDVAARYNTAYAHYRCEVVFEQLAAWLKQAGVPGPTPIHTLRKEFGSLVCSKHGIYVASKALRHRDIYITSQHYVDTKQRLAPGLAAGLLAAPSKGDSPKGKAKQGRVKAAGLLTNGAGPARTHAAAWLIASTGA